MVLLGIFNDLGFKSAAWVSNWWLGYFRRFSGLIIDVFLCIFDGLGLLIGGLGIFGYFRRFSRLIIGVFLDIFDILGFKSAAWVSDRWLGFADWWFGWWVWWPLLAPNGLMVCVCGSVEDLMVCVCVCVW